jgi:methylmalonyl-CoA/ethylmalonyl-CoA epimerase
MIAIGSISHIAIAVPDLDAASAMFERCFGCRAGDVIDVPAQGIRMCSIRMGDLAIELMTPVGTASPIARFLERHPSGGFHHVAFGVRDAMQAARDAKTLGLHLVAPGEPRPGHHGRPIFFLQPRDVVGTLIEIEEGPTEHAREQSPVEML